MLKVLKPGFFSTIQDLGRFGYRSMGVPVSGGMDALAVRKANLLLENQPNDAVMEITMTGPTLLFETPTYICLTGAEMAATLNNEPIKNHNVVQVKAGDILSYGKLESGFRSYLAIKGGFLTQEVLGSRSQYFPVTKGRKLLEGNEISYFETKRYDALISDPKLENHFNSNFLDVEKGPEFMILGDAQLAELFAQEFTVSEKNNRMAYQIAEKIVGHQHNIITSGTLPGTVQLTPGGKLLILMKDGQTTGGYPRILQLTEASICTLAQKRAGDTVQFKLV
ncbi:MAG: biotin-dependent carboxyltransferase family protein [Bacteroidota bacterium]